MTDTPLMFPVLWPYQRSEKKRMQDLDCPHEVPWKMLAAYEEQAGRYTAQSLARLAERGGLGPSEMVAVLENRDFELGMSLEAAVSTLKTMLEAFKNGHVLRGNVHPNKAAQRRYPLSGYPCERCEGEALPHLVDNSSEFYWEHQHDETGMSSARSGCPRFNDGGHFTSTPREKTAVPTHCRRALERGSARRQ